MIRSDLGGIILKRTVLEHMENWFKQILAQNGLVIALYPALILQAMVCFWLAG